MFVVVAVACTATPTGGGPASTSAASSPAGPTPSDPPEGTAEGGATSLRLTPPPGGSFLVRGRYPLVATPCKDAERPTLTGRFPGTLRIGRSDDGTLALTVVLPFDRYLEGIAEVPPSWPKAALEAQAIAARSYALATTGWSGDEGDSLDEPICATTSCQVYRGIPVPADPAHRRWVGAVRRTDGKVLLYEGHLATTVYFSTSNGRTHANEEIFGSAPLAYLRSVAERDDGASPTSRWRVRLPFHDLTRFLRAAGLWPRGRAISAARPRGASLTVRGGGALRSIDAADLRDAVNTWAPCLRPGRYPSETPKGTLPLTIPSRWLHLSSTESALVVTGRGWGHGVGMVQWGAYGKARKGLSASDILAYYYGGLRPEDHPEPGVIRVRVTSGLTVLRISPSDPGAKLGGRALGTGSVLISGDDRLEVRY
jgi:stage II sporulation protein D (peptidoglycan lytic transglycosylase)